MECLPALLPILSYIINTSLQSCTFPQKLKEALVRPSMKNTDMDSESLKNYRPISNLAFLSKIIEKCVAIQLTSYLEDNKLLSRYQSGYRKYHSCETATTRIHNDILVMCDSNSKVVLLLLDLSAAFDTVSHKQLLKKLQNMYGINDDALLWFKSYLSHRSFIVKIKNSCSDREELNIGVPQGSILGPLLFILYTKDLDIIARTHGFEIHFYADDTQLYFTFDSTRTTIDDLEEKICKCMGDLKIWMVQNFLKLNEDKTEVMILSSKHDNLESPISLQLSVDGTASDVVKAFKSLGVYLDDKLSMSQHVSSIVQACNFHIRNLWFIASKLTFKLKIQLVHAMILSKLDYCNSILYGISAKDLQRLQKVQNSAVRFIFGRGKKAHASHLLEKVHFLPVRYRIIFKVALLTYKCVNNIAPSYLKDLVHLRQPGAKNVRLDNDYFLLETPSMSSLQSTERAFSFSAPKVWNSLPYSLRSVDTVHKFKSLLKTHLFGTVFTNNAE